MSKTVAAKHLRVYFALLACILVPFALTFARVKVSLESPAFAPNPTPLGYTYSLLIFAVPIVVFFVWLALNPKYRVERTAALLSVMGVFLLGTLLDIGFGYEFFTFPNEGSYLGWKLPAFSWAQGRFVPDYLPIEEFGFYLLGGTYMLCSYLWGVLYWFKRYNHPDHAAEVRTLPRLVRFDGWLLALGVVLFAAGLVAKALSPFPEGFPGYYTFLVVMAFIPIVFCFSVVSRLVNWRAFAFMSFTLLLVSIVYEAALGVPYGWWRYQDDAMLGYFIVAWSNLPVEAVFLWIAAGFGTVLLFEFIRAWRYMDRSLVRAALGPKDGPRARFCASYVDKGLPLYLDDGIGLPVPAAPYVNTVGQLSNFFLKVDPEAPRRLVEKYLNSVVRKDIRYVPFLNVVLVTFARLQGYVNRNDGTPIGQLPEGDMVFWIPTLAVREWFKIPLPSHIAMFPYRLYVDSAYGICSGREALGLFKNWASFEGGDDPSRPTVRMDVLGLEDFNPTKVGGMRPLIDVRPSEGAPVDDGESGTPFSDASDCLRRGFAALKGTANGNIAPGLLTGLVDIVVDMLEPEVKVVSLKQFRDVGDPRLACLQQVVEIETTVTDFQQGGFYAGRHDVRFHPVATDTLARDLGVVFDAPGVQRGVWGFWARATFTMGKGNVVR